MSVNLSLFAGAGAQFFDDNGVPLAGGLIYTYSAGSTSPLAAYTSITGLTALPNPIVLNAAGRVPTGEIWLTAGVTYKFVVYTSTSVLVASYDNINGTYIATDLADTVNPANGDALVGFRQSSSTGNLPNAVGRTVHQKLQDIISFKDFGAVGNGTTDDTTAIQNALAAAATLTNSDYVVVDGSDGLYAVSNVITVTSNIVLQNAAFLALASANWTSLNAVLLVKGSSINIENCSVDANTQAKVAIKNDGASNIIFDNVKAVHFTEKGFYINDSCQLLQCRANQWAGSDSQVNDPAQRTAYPLYISSGATDSKYISSVFAWGKAPVYIEKGTHHLLFNGCHFYNGIPDSSIAMPNSTNIDCYGYAITVVGSYIDNGTIKLNCGNAGPDDPDFVLANCITLYDSDKATITGWVTATTDTADTNVGRLVVSGNRFAKSTSLPIVDLQTTGAGTWTSSATQLAKAKYSLGISPNPNFFLSSSTTDATVVKAIASHPTRGSIEVIDKSTTNDNGAEFGSVGNDLAMRTNNVVRVQYSTTDANWDFQNNKLKNWKQFQKGQNTSYTIVEADSGTLFTCVNGAATVVFTLTASAGVGTRASLVKTGAGTVTIAPETNATINGATASITAVQYALIELVVFRNSNGASAEWALLT